MKKVRLSPQDLESWHLKAMAPLCQQHGGVDPQALYTYFYFYPVDKSREEAMDHIENLFALARMRGK